MNERIKELAELAGMYIVDDEFSTYGKFAEKFAELIVKEYDQVLTNQMREYRFDERVHLGLGDVRFTIGMQEDILEKVKQHFGVECNCVGVNTAPPKRDLTCVCGAVWEGETMVHPPRDREWVGLREDEIFSILENLQTIYNRPPTEDSRIIFARAVEQALKEKNNW